MIKHIPRWFENPKKCQYCGSEMYPKCWSGKNRMRCETEKRYKLKKYCNNTCRSKVLEESSPEENYFYGKSMSPWNKGKGKGCRVKQTSGYVRVISKNYKSWEYEHRLVMSDSDIKDKVVHHINGIKHDNRKENLIVLTQSEHAKLHAKQRNTTVSLAE